MLGLGHREQDVKHRRLSSRAFTLIELPVVRQRERSAFTLIELLVVIAILLLLVGLLVPYLRRVRELAERAECQSMMRLLGTAGQSFAAEHNGRGPGRAVQYHYYSDGGARGWTWVEVLNIEYFGVNTPGWTHTEVRIQRHGWERYNKTDIYCPTMKPWRNNLWPRAYMWNGDAAGGPNWESSGQPYEGPYGKRIDNPADVDPGYATADIYALGARMDMFLQPSYQFLVVEGEKGSDYVGAIWPASAPHRATLGDDSGKPPWSGCRGTFAFRHLKGNERSMYVQRATANVLYFDGHVEVIRPNDRLNAYDRFNIRY